MQPEIIFIVDGFDKDGVIVTPTDRVKQISPNWQPNLYDKHKQYIQKYTGNRIKFAPLHEIDSFDPNKRYFYFIPMNDFHGTAQQYFFLLDKETQLRFAENQVGFYFCQDFEMYPNFDFTFFVNYIGWVRLFRDAHSFPQIPISFSMCAEINPDQKLILRRAFMAQVNFINSPLMNVFARDEMFNKFRDNKINIDFDKILDEYLTSPKLKSYMALTRDPKHHRLTMMHALRAFNLMDDGYISNLLIRPYSSEPLNHYNMEFVHKIKDDMTRHGGIPFMQIDELPDELIPGIYHGIGGDIPFEHMKSSCYDLVQETATRYDSLHTIDMAVLTEKTLKSLLFGRPFIVNGGPRSLHILKRWGFKTCDFLFDESYDGKKLYLDRQQDIINNIARYYKNYELIMNIVRQNKYILEHNMNHIINFPVEDLLVDAINNPWL